MFVEASASHPHSRVSALSASVTTHAVVGIVVLWLAARPAPPAASDVPRAAAKHDLVWVATAGLGGGGGGGGDRTRAAAAARRPGRDRLTVPLPVAARDLESTMSRPLDSVVIPARPMANGTETAPGIIASASTALFTQGPGTDGGAGNGNRGGIGDGSGEGVGDGEHAGIGGRAFAPGGGITTPQLLHQVRPSYTAEAMRAKIQGVVRLECVVLADGTVGDVRVARSLDSAFGLDAEAIKAARQWRFVPGRRLGEPVAVLVTIELVFSLR
jgi:protein TonB